MALNGGGTTCTQAAPCNSYSSALAAVLAGGTIVVLGPMFGGTATITRAVTIRGDSDAAGALYVDGTVQPTFTITALPDDIVTIDNMRMSGGGIEFRSGAHLHVINSVIGNQTARGEAGIRFSPNSAARLSVVNTIIKGVGNETGGGIVVNPQAGGSARVNIERSSVNGGAFGIAADGSRSLAGINMTISSSMVGGAAQDGVIATTPSGGAPIGVLLVNSQSVNNAIGVRAIGPNVTVRLDNTAVAGNGTGLAFGSGGALLSKGNNTVEANGTNGSFSGAIAAK